LEEKVKKFLFIVILLVITFNTLYNITNNTDSVYFYEFPLQPDSDEWKKLKSHVEMIEVCQIPKNILESISTEGLIETVLNYPNLGDILAYTDYLKGFKSVYKHFNGLQELYKRENIMQLLIKKYKELNHMKIPDLELHNIEWMRFYTKMVGLEMILSQKFLLKKVDLSKKVDLLKETVKRFENSDKTIGYSVKNNKGSFYLLDNLMSSLDYEPYCKEIISENFNSMKIVFKNTGYIPEELKQKTLKYARSFILEYEKESDNDK